MLRATAVIATALALGSCNAVQPKPLCKAQPAEYAAKYVRTGTTGMCGDDKILTGEVINVQYYRADPKDPNGTPSIAIEPQSVADAIAAGDEAKVTVKSMEEFSIGKYAATEPGDNDMCVVKTMTDTDVMVAEIPGNPAAMPPTETVPAQHLKYKWSNLTMMVTPLSNAVYFGADLERTDGDCVVTYKVSAVNPTVFCGDGMKPVLDESGNPKTDKMGNVEMEPDPSTGKPNPDACLAVQGSGLNPYIAYTCDASVDGMTGTHLCLVKDQFPKLK